MTYKGSNAVRPGPNSTAEGQIDFRGDQPPTQGPELVYKQPFTTQAPGAPDAETDDLLSDAGVTNPEPPTGYDIDPNLAPNVYPHEQGKDSYKGIPGDGIVPG